MGTSLGTRSLLVDLFAKRVVVLKVDLQEWLIHESRWQS